MAHGPFDQIAGAFLDAPTAVRSGSASARRTLVLVGHMPMPAGLWLRQVADQIGRDAGPVGLVRIENDAVQLMVFRGAGLCPPIRSEASLQDALRAVGSAVANWIIVPFSGHELEVPEGTSDALLVTSADEPAVLAAYTILKKFVAARGQRGSRARLPGVAVEVLGASLEASAHAAESLAATAREFLSIDLPFRGSIHRIAPVEPTLQRTFDLQAPTLAQVYAMLAEAELDSARVASSGPSGALAGILGGTRGDRFSARPERVPPRRAPLPLDAGPIPFTRPSTVSPAQPTLPPRTVRGPVGTAPSAPSTTSAAPSPSTPSVLPPVPTTPVLPGRGPAPEVRRAPVVRDALAAAVRGDETASSPLETTPIAATIAPSSDTLAAARETLRAASASISAAAADARSAGVLSPVPAQPVEARALATELPASLAAHVEGLAMLPFRAPREQGIELAVDGRGRMHVVGRASDSAALLRVRAWAREHAAILRLADARLTSDDEPALDVFVADMRESRAIDGATVHVLTLVEVAGRRGYLAQVAPA